MRTLSNRLYIYKRIFQNITLSLLLFTVVGCASSVDKTVLREGVSHQANNEQAGVYQAALKTKQDIVVKFTFDLQSNQIKIIDVLHQEFPKQDELIRTYKQNAQSIKTKGVMTDYLMITKNGQYKCVSCEKLTGTDMVSIYFDSEINNPIGSIVCTALLPLTIISPDTKGTNIAYTHHVVEQDRINIIGLSVDRLLTQKLRKDVSQFAQSQPQALAELFKKLPNYDKGPALKQLRSLGGFERLYCAYMISGAKEDFIAMADKAKTQNEKMKLELAALNTVQDKTKIFELTITPRKGCQENYEGSPGLFKVKAFQTSQNVDVNIGLKIKDMSVMNIKYNDLNVKVKVSCIATRSCILRSNILGNKDYEDKITRSNVLILKLRPGKLSDEGTVSLTDIPLSYTDVGLMGGTTRCQATGDIQFEAEIVDVSPAS